VETPTSVPRLAQQIEDRLADAARPDAAVDLTGLAPTESMAESRTAARARLALARSGLATGRRGTNPATLQDALEHAQAASTALTELSRRAQALSRKTLDGTLGGAVAAAENAFNLTALSFSTLERRSGQSGVVPARVVTEHDRLRKTVDGLQQRFERARADGDSTGLAETTRLVLEARAGVEGLAGSFGPVTLRDRGVSPALEEGARAFLKGEYQQALAALDTVSGLAAPLQVHVHLFRAAAQYALYVRSGETDQALLSGARTEIERCTDLDPAIEPDPRVYAPAFLRLFREGRTPGAQATR
jgi:hypothetical protein